MLPYHAFNDNGEGRGTTRPECRVCTSFRYSSQEGAKAEIASRFNGDFKAGMKALYAKKKKSLDPFETAVLLGVSESQVGNLVEAGLLNPSVKGGGNYDKADVLALNDRHEDLAYYRFRSSGDYWDSHNRVKLSNKIPKWANASEESQLTFIGDQNAECGQQHEPLEADVSEADVAEIAEFFGGWVGVAHAYRDGVSDLLKRIEPHAQALGETPMGYLSFFAPGLHSAIIIHDDFLKRFTGEQDAGVANGEEYPPPTFTPSAEDQSTYDLSELKDDYVYMSGGDRQSPPVYKRYSLFGGSEGEGGLNR